jgi:hypothetical protein
VTVAAAGGKQFAIGRTNCRVDYGNGAHARTTVLNRALNVAGAVIDQNFAVAGNIDLAKLDNGRRDHADREETDSSAGALGSLDRLAVENRRAFFNVNIVDARGLALMHFQTANQRDRRKARVLITLRMLRWWNVGRRRALPQGQGRYEQNQCNNFDPMFHCAKPQFTIFVSLLAHDRRVNSGLCRPVQK